MIGIYKITNMKNNKVYVGQSKNVGKRKRQHFDALAKHSHENTSMQKDYNKSARYFRFDILECCELQELNDREIYWVDFYKSSDSRYGYNLTIGGGYKRKKRSCKTRGLLDQLTDGG